MNEGGPYRLHSRKRAKGSVFCALGTFQSFGNFCSGDSGTVTVPRGTVRAGRRNATDRLPGRMVKTGSSTYVIDTRIPGKRDIPNVLPCTRPALKLFTNISVTPPSHLVRVQVGGTHQSVDTRKASIGKHAGRQASRVVHGRRSAQSEPATAGRKAGEGPRSVGQRESVRRMARASHATWNSPSRRRIA